MQNKLKRLAIMEDAWLKQGAPEGMPEGSSDTQRMGGGCLVYLVSVSQGLEKSK